MDSKAVRSAKERARSSAAELLSNLPADVVAGAERLLSDGDESLNALWGTGRLTSSEFSLAVLDYYVAIYKGPWDLKTQRAQDKWMGEFEETLEKLLLLMSEGPVEPELFGFPVRDTPLMKLARAWGIQIPDESVEGYFGQMGELERKADSTNWTLADALRAYLLQVKTDHSAGQDLKKPADPYANRTRFLRRCSVSVAFTHAELAIIAGALFDDEKLDDRQVRRIVAG